MPIYRVVTRGVNEQGRDVTTGMRVEADDVGHAVELFHTQLCQTYRLEVFEQNAEGRDMEPGPIP